MVFHYFININIHVETFKITLLTINKMKKLENLTRFEILDSVWISF